MIRAYVFGGIYAFTPHKTYKKKLLNIKVLYCCFARYFMKQLPDPRFVK